MSNKKLLLLFLALGVGVIFSGCGKSLGQTAAEKIIENKTGVKVEQNGDTVKIQDQQGNTMVATSGKSIPNDFPADAPYYKNGRIETASTMDLSDGKSYSAIIMTNDSIESIAKFYREELKNNNWKVNVDSTIGEMVTIGAQKGQANASILITPNTDGVNQEKTSITQVIAVKK